MLTDPLLIGAAAETSDTTPASGLSLALSSESNVPNASLRRQVESAVRTWLLRFSVINTKENKPYGTKRIQTRLELNLFAVDGTPLTIVGSVFIGIPNSADVTSVDVTLVRRYLGQYLLFGGGLTAANLSNGDTYFARQQAYEG